MKKSANTKVWQCSGLDHKRYRILMRGREGDRVRRISVTNMVPAACISEARGQHMS